MATRRGFLHRSKATRGQHDAGSHPVDRIVRPCFCVDSAHGFLSAGVYGAEGRHPCMNGVTKV